MHHHVPPPPPQSQFITWEDRWGRAGDGKTLKLKGVWGRDVIESILVGISFLPHLPSHRHGHESRYLAPRMVLVLEQRKSDRSCTT